ncbi:MAG: TonB-dependent receptor, partial [Gemmatimonadetes bacterium]|nr:TonB-dependent receptor [Gemmatimonadota bacterium]
GAALPGVEVRDARTSAVLGVSGPDGRFDFEVKGAGAELVLEFRRPDRIPQIRHTDCGADVRVELAAAGNGPDVLEVSATRLDASADDAPVRVERLDAGEISAATAASPSLAQAIQQIPGVGAVGRDGFTAAPTIRGLGRDRSLLVLEGVRLSSDRGVGPTGSFLDPFLLRSVDVVRGASGVAYGSGAMGGVVSIGLGAVPHEPHASLRVSGSTNGEGRLVAGRAGGEAGSWGVTGGGFYRTLDDYTFPDGDGLTGGDAVNSGMQNVGGTLAAERPLGDGGLRVVLVGTRAEDVGRPTTRDSRLDTIGEEDHLLGSVRYSSAREGRRNEFTAGLHRPRTVNRTERFDDAGNRTRTGTTENESLDLSVSALVERPRAGGTWLGGVDAFGRTGADATETNVFFRSPATPDQTVELFRDATRLDLGAFGGVRRTIGFSGEVLLAGRLDYVRRTAAGEKDADWVAPSATLGVVLPIDRTWTLKGTIGRSFRAPRIQELYFAGDRPGGSRLANPDLEPETAWSAEGGVRWSRGAWSGEAALFGLLADDLIVQLPVDAAGDTLRNENVADGTILGAEMAVGWTRPDDAAGASLSYAFLTGEDQDGNALPDIPSGELRVSGNVRAWRDEAGRDARLTATLRAGAAKTPFAAGTDERWYSPALGATDIGGDEEGHPGFARLDVGVTARVHPRAELDLALTNVLDSRHIDRAESRAYPQPGRSLQVQLTVGE